MLALLLALSVPTVDVGIAGIFRPTSVTVEWEDERAALSVDGARVRVEKNGKDRVVDRFAVDGPFRAGVEETRPYAGSLVVIATNGVLRLVNTVALEDYVASVAECELPDAPEEAGRAMGVLARTYALRNRARHAKEGFDLCDLTHCQVYKGSREESAAARATEGERLVFGSEPAEIFFSAVCGGRTADASTVWGQRVPYLTGVSDGASCAHAENARWSSRLAAKDVMAALSRPYGQVKDIAIAKRDASGRAIAIRLSPSDREISAESFRITIGRALGWASLKSTWFTLTRDGDDLVFSGRGFGHGVGFCQAGAATMAREGREYREILAHYFPGTRLTKGEPRDGSLSDAIADALGREDAGAILMDVRTGKILAIANEELMVRSAFAAGSTFKLVTAAAALEEGGVDPSTRFSCEGKWRGYKCWSESGHGDADAPHALAVSCNVFWYRAGQTVAPVSLLRHAREFGLGRATGADLPHEATGSLPEWGASADRALAAIGDGESDADRVYVTGLQLAVISAAIANGGTRVIPRIGDAVETTDLALPRSREILRRGMIEGSIYGTGADGGVAGKTGTARWKGGWRMHAWFMGFAPIDDPEVAVVVFIREGTGAKDAAPAAARVIEAWRRSSVRSPPVRSP